MILEAAEAQAHAEQALGRAFTADEGERFRESIKAAHRAAKARRQTVIIDPPLISEGDQGRTRADVERDASAMGLLFCLALCACAILGGLWWVGWRP